MLILQKYIWPSNGTFTLPDTETDTETDKLTQDPMGICVGVVSVRYEHLNTILYKLFLSAISDIILFI